MESSSEARGQTVSVWRGGRLEKGKRREGSADRSVSCAAQSDRALLELQKPARLGWVSLIKEVTVVVF